ncbi:MAG TPA: rod shape-determining protein MreD [Gemmatimonadales bacterium]|nr:rod shape-determining protein MreD [Gemmatimonadales bacterium]
MSPRRGEGRLFLGFILLFALHFYIRPRIFDGRAAPDFLLCALMLVAVRSRPGWAAVAGFLVGLASDVLTPAAFGAGALAHTVIAYIAAWGRAVFFPDNLLVNAGLFAGGVWLRNAIVLLASATPSGQLSSGLLVWAPLQAVSTAAAGLVLLFLFRDWFAIRIEA